MPPLEENQTNEEKIKIKIQVFSQRDGFKLLDLENAMTQRWKINNTRTKKYRKQIRCYKGIFMVVM